MKTEYIYTIARGYRSCTVWCCNQRTRQRQCQLRLTPNKNLTRKGRYAEIYRFLKPLVPVPPYEPAKSEPAPTKDKRPAHPVEFENAELGDEG